MSETRYLSIDEAIAIHQKTIENSGGGAGGSLNTGTLDGVLEHIRNDDYYPEFVDKITHLFFCTCKFHCFQDGNKRAAITLSAHFLLINGYMKVAESFFRTMENISYHVAAGKIDKPLLRDIMESVLKGEIDEDESLKLAVYCAISEK